ncbi:MAG: glycosyltransferase family 4 protein [Fervidobacterium sp.]
MRKEVSENFFDSNKLTNFSKHEIVVLCPTRVSGTLNQSLRRVLKYLTENGYKTTLIIQDKPSGLFDDIANSTDIITVPSILGFIFAHFKRLYSLLKRFFTKKSMEEKNVSLPRFDEVIPFSNDSVIQELMSLIKSVESVVIISLWFFYQRLRGKYKKSIIWGYERAGAIVGLVISRAFKLPLVTSFQGTILYPWLVSRGHLKTFLRFPFDYISTSIKSDLVIMTNDGTNGDRVLHILKHSIERILFLPNGIDYKDIYPFIEERKKFLAERIKNGKNEYIFVVASRLDPWKRVDRAIYVAEALKKAGIKFKLLIIGTGKVEKELMRLAKELEVSEHVNFLGRRSYNETIKLIAFSDILFSFCDHSNFTNSVQDALALGVPVLTLEDGSLDFFKGHKLLFKVPLSECFPEKTANVVKLILEDMVDKNFDSEKFKLPTWEERMKRISESLDRLTQNSKSHN